MSARANDRLPPHSVEMEMAVLGCALTSPAECLPVCLSRLPGAEVFYDLRHKTIYAAITRMFDRNEPVDIITIRARLKAENKLEQIGNESYLNALLDVVTSTANLDYYIESILEKLLLRRMVAVGTNIVAGVYEREHEPEVLLDEAEQSVLGMRAGNNDGIRATAEIVRDAIQRIEDAHNRQGTIGGIETGLAALNKLTDGFHGGEMIVFAARPSMGKTALAMGMAEHAAVTKGLPVGIFSLEMMADQLLLRSLCAQAQINLRDVRAGFLTPQDFQKFTVAAGRISKAPLYIDDSSGLSIMQLRARARRMWQQHGIKLLVVDYLQLLHSTNPKCSENRQQEIADISGGIKNLAKELNIPVIALSQLNREGESEKSKRPKLSHLRESGAIEQDADLVGLLYQPGVTEVETGDESDSIPVNLLIAKQRNGPCGDVRLTFHRAQTRFEIRAEKPEPEDIPRRRTNDD